MSGFRTFETSRVSFGDNRPKAPLVDAALVSPPIKRAPAKQWSEPKICQKGFIPPKPVTPEDFQQPCAFPLRRLMDLVCYITQFPAVHIRGQRRLGNLVRARQILFWLAKNNTEASFVQIGRLVGGRDHTTVMHGVRRVQAVIDRLNIEVSDCPVTMAERLWRAEWPRWK
ncbi:helix-turn-helix domain-containing protein [Methylobacterium fujisawaense]|uniref:helix-turn-helix domain-containing protein n=1 Tax=Methylobacterium fujisawaense TaxID=107400 RepID=UPI00313B43B0